jgi:amidase
VNVTRLLALLPLCSLAVAGFAQQPAVVHYHASIDTAKFLFGPAAPVARLKPGDILETNTNAPGALLYMGDGHAAMGDAEIAGTAIEVPMRARMQVSVIRHQKIDWPRLESAEAIMTGGAYRPLDDATRIAFTEPVKWIHDDCGLSEIDAHELLSQVATVHLNEMVDPTSW